jgi:hypothetical protein
MKSLLTFVIGAMALATVSAFSQDAVCRGCDGPDGAAAGAAKARRLDDLGDLCQQKGICDLQAQGKYLLGEPTSQPRHQKRQPIYSKEQINAMARAGLLSVEQIVWLYRYNAGEDHLGPFPPSR